MNVIINQGLSFIGFCIYSCIIIATVTLPIWGSKLIEEHLEGKHKALRVTRTDRNQGLNHNSIIASLGTTTAGVFIIQILPLIFSMINDIGGAYSVNTVYSEHLSGSGMGEFVDSFYGLTAQIGDILQTSAPMAAVGLGGYNLLTNLSRGLPAIKSRS